MSNAKDGRPIRVDIKFGDELEDIKVERIKRGVDKKLKSDKRLTLAIIKHSLWRRIKEDIIEHPLSSK